MTSELKEGAHALHSLWNVRLSKHRNRQNAVLKLNETYNNPIGIQNTWKVYIVAFEYNTKIYEFQER